MPYQSYRNCSRCQATSRSTGQRCRRSTCKYGPYCWQHTKSILGVYVRNVPGGRGMGLFAARDLPAGTKIPYTGKREKRDAYDRRFPGDLRMEYAVTSAGIVTDAALTDSGVGRYANDPRPLPPSRANARIVPDTRRGKPRGSVQLKLTKNVRKGREILTAYGREYWESQIPGPAINQRHRTWMNPNRNR